MDEIGKDANGLTLHLSQVDFGIARQSLNEVTNGIKIADSEFAARLGGSRSEPGISCICSGTPSTLQECRMERAPARQLIRGE
jgi:hypothetical protein